MLLDPNKTRMKILHIYINVGILGIPERRYMLLVSRDTGYT
jgi:hypothetical protein